MMFGHYEGPPERLFDVPDPEWPAYVEACRVADEAERAYLAAAEACNIAYERTYDYRETERLHALPPRCQRCGVETPRPEDAPPGRNWRVCDRHQCRFNRYGIRCKGHVKGNDVLCGTHRHRETERILKASRVP